MNEFLDIIRRSLSLDPGLWQELLANPEALRFRPALWLVLLAGLSEALAQSVVLFVSRVRPSRFVLSLLLSAALLALGYLFYVASIEFMAEVVFGKPRLNALAFKMIALTYAPFIFSVVTLTPYLGRAVAALLTVYHVLALLIAVSVSYGFSPRQGLLCLAASWLLLQVLRGSLGRPLVWLTRALRNRVAGTALMDRQTLRRYYAELVAAQPTVVQAAPPPEEAEQKSGQKRERDTR